MTHDTSQIEALLDGSAEGVRKNFAGLSSAAVAAKRARLLQDAIDGHGTRLIDPADFDAAAQVIAANGEISYHEWAHAELARVAEAAGQPEPDRDAIDLAIGALAMLVAHGGGSGESGAETADEEDEQPAAPQDEAAAEPSPEPPAPPAGTIESPPAMPSIEPRDSDEQAPEEAAPAARTAAEPDPIGRPAAPNAVVQQAIESYEALAAAVMPNLPLDQWRQAELHVALIRSATSLTLDARNATVRREAPAAPAAPPARREGGGDFRGGQQDRRRGPGRDDRRDDRRGGRGRDDFRGGRRDDRRDDRGERRSGSSRVEESGLPGRSAFCNCGCKCFADFTEGMTGPCPLCDCGRSDCACNGERGERLLNTDGIWHWVRS